MKHLKLLLISLFVINFTHAQTNATDTAIAAINLKSSAEKMGRLFIEKNYTQYVKFIHPKILQMAVGQAKIIALLKKSLKDVESQGITFQNVVIGSSSKIIITKTGLQSVVPQLLQLKTKTGLLDATSYLIATSADKGKTWYFIDTSGKTLAQMKSAFPTLSDELVIPEKKPPVMHND